MASIPVVLILAGSLTIISIIDGRINKRYQQALDDLASEIQRTQRAEKQYQQAVQRYEHALHECTTGV